MLSLNDVSSGYKGREVLQGITLKVLRESIVTLLGANGAGKSTTLNTIVGLAHKTAGAIEVDGKSVSDLSPDQILRRGVSLVPERRELFANMSVRDNLMLGGLLQDSKRSRYEDFERMLEIFPRLRERLNQVAKTLSGGEQQMLAIARALMSRPTYLLLDEPSLGLAPKIVDEILQVIVQIRNSGTTVLMVEQNAFLALEIANYGYVMETGAITLEGRPADLRNNPLIQDSYL